MSKFVETSYSSGKEILAFKDHYLSMAAMMDKTGVEADERGRKIVRKGSFVGGASASVFTDRSQKLRAVHDIASLSTAMTGDNNDITLTSKIPGAAGAEISLALVDPSGNSADLAVTVTGKDISVSLATGSGGAITTTASELIAAINGDAEAAELVTAALKGSDSGAGTVTALAKASLANSGITGASVVDGVLLNDVDVTFGDAACSLLIHGYLKTAALPEAPTSAMIAALSKNVFLGFIEN